MVCSLAGECRWEYTVKVARRAGFATRTVTVPRGAWSVGGFSDSVFGILAQFAAGELNADHWVGVIESLAV